MGASQRRKGASYEREVCDIFSDALDEDFKRNIGQARDGGNDIDVRQLVVECKRRKRIDTLYDWIAQAVSAAIRRKEEDPHDPAIPVVVTRGDAGDNLIILRLSDFLTLTRDALE